MTIPLSHQQFHQVHDLCTMGVLAIDADAVIGYVNPTVLAQTELEKEKLIGHSLFAFYHDTGLGSPNKKKLLALDEIIDQEFSVNGKSGNDQWVLMSSKVYRDEQGEVQTYLFVRDISILKRKEKLSSYLNKAAEELAKARDTQSALDQISRVIVPKFANWFSIDLLKDELLELLLLMHEDPDKIKWAQEYRQHYPTDLNSNSGTALVLKTGKPLFIPIVTAEMVAASISDPVQWEAIQQVGVQSVITVALSGNDKITGLLTFISATPGRHYDETDLEFAQNFGNLIGLALENTRLNEEAATEIRGRKQSEELFRFLTDAIPHKLWTSGPDGGVTYYNRGWYDYTGIGDFEVLREKVWDIIHPDDRATAAEEWQRLIQGGNPVDTEQRLQRHDGEYRWHLSRLTAHKDEAGQTVLWVGTSTDIHEQKTSRMEVTEANYELATINEELTAVNEVQATINEDLIQTERSLQQMVSELEASENRFRFLVQGAPVAIAVLNRRELIIESANNMILEVWGKTPAIIGLPLAIALPELQGQPFLHLLDEVYMSGEAYHGYQTRALLEHEGKLQEFYFDFIYQPLQEEYGTHSVMIVATDVTDQVNAKKELEAAYEQVRLSKQAAQLGTFDMDILRGTMEWDERCRTLFGISHQDPVTYEKDFISGLHPDDRERVLQVISQVMDKSKNNGNYDVEYRTVGVDDRQIHWVRAKGKAYFNEQEQPVRFIGSVLDITDQKNYDDKLQRYTRNVEILNTVGKLVAESLDIEAILQRVTDATTQVTGAAFGAFFYNQLDERGESYMLFTLSGAPREAFEKFGMPRNTAVFNPTFSGEEIVRVDDITKDPRYGHNHPHHGMPKGHLPVVSYLAVPVISKSGNVIGGLFYGHPEPGKFTSEHENLVVGIANQASIALDNAKLYEEIQKLNAKKDEFIGLASHELKTPVTSLNGYLQIVSRRLPEGDMNRPFIEKALLQIRKLSDLISDLLDVSKIESGQLPLSFTSFDLVSFLREVIEQFQYGTRSHHIGFQSDKKSLMISADQQRIEQVVINLLSNAVKYSPASDLVNVSLFGEGHTAIVSVQDFGIGINKEYRDRIFSRFYRVEDLAAHISGLGIGLYISKEIISRHQGALKVESENGKGSVFSFEIPTSQ